jgi:hypothetical protein
LSRSRSRVCLQDGLKLDLNSLAKNRFILRGLRTSGRGIRWVHSYWGEVASGTISADMSGQSEGWLRIELGALDQWIKLVARPRHYGGRQWYFVCPETNRQVSVLWKPAGSWRFCSRQTWGRRVAYSSQYLDRDSRAHAGQSKIKHRLCAIGKFDPDEWDMPPKPKWMRWKTYNRYEEKFEQYDDILDNGFAEAAAKLTGLKIF